MNNSRKFQEFKDERWTELRHHVIELANATRGAAAIVESLQDGVIEKRSVEFCKYLVVKSLCRFADEMDELAELTDDVTMKKDFSKQV